MHNIRNILKQYFGYDAFRPMQEEIVQSVLAGNDTLALLPTGGGKSICFQVPALAQDGLCLVISPLIALMKDQVENLRKKGVTALAIYSGMSRRDALNTLEIATGSNCKFLYVSPERLETNLFKEFLPALPINLEDALARGKLRDSDSTAPLDPRQRACIEDKPAHAVAHRSQRDE